MSKLKRNKSKGVITSTPVSLDDSASEFSSICTGTIPFSAPSTQPPAAKKLGQKSDIKEKDTLDTNENLDSLSTEQLKDSDDTTLGTCPMCHKSSLDSQHLKKCGLRHGLSTAKLLEVKKLAVRWHQEKLALGIPATASSASIATKPKPKSKKRIARADQDTGGVDDDLALALALSVSVQQTQDNESNSARPADEPPKMWLPRPPPLADKKAKRMQKGMVTNSVLQSRTTEERDRLLGERVTTILISEKGDTPLPGCLKRSHLELNKKPSGSNYYWKLSSELNSLDKSGFMVRNLSQYLESDKSIEGPTENKIDNKPDLPVSSYQQLSVDWLNLLRSGTNSDTVLLCKGEKQLAAHSLVLRIRCPILLNEAVVETSDSGLKNYTIVLSQFQTQSVQMILRYLYGGVFDSNDLSTKVLLTEVRNIAAKFRLMEVEMWLRQVHIEEDDECFTDVTHEDDGFAETATLNDIDKKDSQCLDALLNCLDENVGCDEYAEKACDSMDDWDSVCEYMTQKNHISLDDDDDGGGKEKDNDESNGEAKLNSVEITHSSPRTHLNRSNDENKKNCDNSPTTKEIIGNEEEGCDVISVDSDFRLHISSRMSPEQSCKFKPNRSISPDMFVSDDEDESPDILCKSSTSDNSTIKEAEDEIKNLFDGDGLSNKRKNYSLSPPLDQNKRTKIDAQFQFDEELPTPNKYSSVDSKLSPPETPNSVVDLTQESSPILSSDKAACVEGILDDYSVSILESKETEDNIIAELNMLSSRLSVKDATEKELAACLVYLSDIKVTVPALLATKAGRIVRKLRSHSGEVGKLASSLVAQWKKIVLEYIPPSPKNIDNDVIPVLERTGLGGRVSDSGMSPVTGTRLHAQVRSNGSGFSDSIDNVDYGSTSPKQHIQVSGDCDMDAAESLESPLKTDCNKLAENEDERSDIDNYCVGELPTLVDEEQHFQMVADHVEFTSQSDHPCLNTSEIQLEAGETSKVTPKKLDTKPPLWPSNYAVGASTPITPLPDYSSMLSPQLQKELARFGLKAVPRRKAAALLNHIYEKTHPLVPMTPQNAPILKNKELTKVPMARKLVEKLDENNEDVNECDNKDADDSSDLSQNSSQELEYGGYCLAEESIMDQGTEEPELTASTNLHDQLDNFIRNRTSLHQQMLEYEPIWLNQFQKDVKETGIKCNLHQLQEFLDLRCICFRSEAAQKRNQPKSPTKRNKRKSPTKKRSPKKKVQLEGSSTGETCQQRARTKATNPRIKKA